MLRYFWLGAQAALTFSFNRPTTPAVYSAALATSGPIVSNVNNYVFSILFIVALFLVLTKAIGASVAFIMLVKNPYDAILMGTV